MTILLVDSSFEHSTACVYIQKRPSYGPIFSCMYFVDKFAIICRSNLLKTVLYDNVKIIIVWCKIKADNDAIFLVKFGGQTVDPIVSYRPTVCRPIAEQKNPKDSFHTLNIQGYLSRSRPQGQDLLYSVRPSPRYRISKNQIITFASGKDDVWSLKRWASTFGSQKG